MLAKREKIKFSDAQLESLKNIGRETASVYYLQDTVALLAQDLMNAKAALREIQVGVQDLPLSHDLREYRILRTTRELLGEPK